MKKGDVFYRATSSMSELVIKDIHGDGDIFVSSKDGDCTTCAAENEDGSIRLIFEEVNAYPTIELAYKARMAIIKSRFKKAGEIFTKEKYDLKQNLARRSNPAP